ncbi:MAG: SAM-dependent methyltransferase [Nitrososphaerota archaeon]
MEICFHPIGYVETEYSDEEVAMSWPRGVEGRIVIYPQYSSGLIGLEGFSHIIAIAWLHKVPESARTTLRVRFKRLIMMGLSPEEIPEVGVFCSDSPHRPNPIALTILGLKRVDGSMLHVSGLDLYNGTPILDLRAYTPSYSIDDYMLPSWYMELLERLKRMGISWKKL